MDEIPTYNHSKPDLDAAPEPSFHYYAARISILAPIIATAFVRGAVWGLKDIKTTWSLLVIVVLGFLLAGIYVLSLVFGLVALTGASRRGNEGSLRSSVLGILVSGALLGWWGVGFVHGYQMAMQNRKTAQTVTRAANEMDKDLKKEIAEKGTITPDAVQGNAQKMKTALDDASKKLTGDEALAAKAASAYLARMQTLMADYTTAAQAIKSPPVLNMKDVDQREQLAARKAAVNKFLEANEKLISFFTKAESIVREELVRAKAPPAVLEASLRSYRKTGDEINYLTVQIRMTDQRIGNAMLGMLGLLDSNWGNWKYSPEKKNVVFQNTSVVAKYNEYFKDMDAAAKEQARLQSQLLNLPAVASAQ